MFQQYRWTSLYMICFVQITKCRFHMIKGALWNFLVNKQCMLTFCVSQQNALAVSTKFFLIKHLQGLLFSTSFTSMFTPFFLPLLCLMEFSCPGLPIGRIHMCMQCTIQKHKNVVPWCNQQLKAPHGTFNTLRLLLISSNKQPIRFLQCCEFCQAQVINTIILNLISLAQKCDYSGKRLTSSASAI